MNPNRLLVFSAFALAAGCSAGQATDIGVSNDGNTVYCLGNVGNTNGDYPVYKYDVTRGLREQLPNQYGVAIDAANDGSAFVVNSAGGVWHINANIVPNSNVTTTPTATQFGNTPATDVTVGADGDVFLVGKADAGTDFPIYMCDPTGTNLTVISNGFGTRVSAASQFDVTVVNSGNQIWTTVSAPTQSSSLGGGGGGSSGSCWRVCNQ